MLNFYKEDTSFEYHGKLACRRWLQAVAEAESCRLGQVNVIFCSDVYLLEINRKFLKHDYYTDIITFDYREENVLSGDLFISVDSVKENASHYGEEFSRETDRVIVHGLLHIIGYDDHTDADRKIMRSKEDFYLERKKDAEKI